MSKGAGCCTRVSLISSLWYRLFLGKMEERFMRQTWEGGGVLENQDGSLQRRSSVGRAGRSSTTLVRLSALSEFDRLGVHTNLRHYISRAIWFASPAVGTVSCWSTCSTLLGVETSIIPRGGINLIQISAKHLGPRTVGGTPKFAEGAVDHLDP